MTDTACAKALAIAVKELNVRESLVWSKTKISDDGYTTDEDLFAALDKDLGVKFKWNPGPTIDGGTLHCESKSIPSTNDSIFSILSLYNCKCLMQSFLLKPIIFIKLISASLIRNY
jgi:hypothetical protein